MKRIVAPHMAGVNVERARVSGWLLLLCVLLLVWQPINLALVASRVVDQIAFRGLPLALALVARLLVTALGIAAGIMLTRRRSGAVAVAKMALVASALADVWVYTTSYFPNSRMPGDAPLHVAASLLHHGIWLAYLFRSKRVRKMFG